MTDRNDPTWHRMSIPGVGVKKLAAANGDEQLKYAAASSSGTASQKKDLALDIPPAPAGVSQLEWTAYMQIVGKKSTKAKPKGPSSSHVQDISHESAAIPPKQSVDAADIAEKKPAGTSLAEWAHYLKAVGLAMVQSTKAKQDHVEVSTVMRGRPSPRVMTAAEQAKHCLSPAAEMEAARVALEARRAAARTSKSVEEKDQRLAERRALRLAKTAAKKAKRQAAATEDPSLIFDNPNQDVHGEEAATGSDSNVTDLAPKREENVDDNANSCTNMPATTDEVERHAMKDEKDEIVSKREKRKAKLMEKLAAEQLVSENSSSIPKHEEHSSDVEEHRNGEDEITTATTANAEATTDTQSSSDEGQSNGVSFVQNSADTAYTQPVNAGVEAGVVAGEVFPEPSITTEKGKAKGKGKRSRKKNSPGTRRRNLEAKMASMGSSDVIENGLVTAADDDWLFGASALRSKPWEVPSVEKAAIDEEISLFPTVPDIEPEPQPEPEPEPESEPKELPPGEDQYYDPDLGDDMLFGGAKGIF